MMKKAFMLLALAVALVTHARAEIVVGITDANALVTDRYRATFGGY